jgi:hypothetical protein
MKFGISIFITIILFYSCSEENNNNETKQVTINDENSILADTSYNFQIDKLDSNFIKKNFKYRGKFKDAFKFTDKQGSHIVFTCENFYYSDYIYDTVKIEIDGKEEIINQETYKQNAEVFCFHYLLNHNQFELEWKLYDKSLKCPMDALAFFTNKSLEVTDLNKNGISEIWTMYSVACKGDISPNELILIMYEGDKKYKIKGTSLIDYIKNEKYGGEVEYSDKFNNEKELLNYALKKWRKNIKG